MRPQACLPPRRSPRSLPPRRRRSGWWNCWRPPPEECSMPPTPHDPYDRQYDPDSTDTLPLPVLREEDTGRLAALDEPATEPEEIGREAGRASELERASAMRAQPRMAVRDASVGS